MAGEKERGTLETLLSSPAERSEIVLGKLLTVMAFSMATAALNLVCVGVTGALIFRQWRTSAGRRPWPWSGCRWRWSLCPPSSALLPGPGIVRPQHEGRPVLPHAAVDAVVAAGGAAHESGRGTEPGQRLIPVSGLVLLLKTLLEGSYLQALQYLPVVLAVTLAACWLAVRWAVEQFNKESVLFRESERFAVGLWLKHLLRDREPTPSAAEGLFCGVLILVLAFVFRSSVSPPAGFDGFARVTLVLQLAVILTPALLMAVVLTRSPRQTLLLRLPRWKMVPAAAVLAVALHPFIVALNSLIMHLSDRAGNATACRRLANEICLANLGLLILCVAAVPAVCEELAFRGFILSGCRNLGNNRRAIVISAIFFGITHGFLQQSINAFLLGLVLGIWPSQRQPPARRDLPFPAQFDDGSQREDHARVDRPRSRPGLLVHPST